MRAAFIWVLKMLAAERLLSGKTVGDSPTLEVNAAIHSIDHRSTSQRYEASLTAVADVNTDSGCPAFTD